MKLAEALIERADLKAQVAQIIKRMEENTLVPEGEEPAEEVVKLLSIYGSMMTKKEELIIHINKTNSETFLKLKDGEITLADAIIKRDCLKSKISATRKVKESATRKVRGYYPQPEGKQVRTVDVAKLQKMIDDYSRQYRELDTKIQCRNWETELL